MIEIADSWYLSLVEYNRYYYIGVAECRIASMQQQNRESIGIEWKWKTDSCAPYNMNMRIVKANHWAGE